MSASALMMGDIDKNGKVESADARTALRASVGLHQLTSEEFTLADMDNSGKIESADARSILRAAVGLEEKRELVTESATEKEEETTKAPEAQVPSTQAPTTEAPTTEAPTTEAPTTEAPTTEAPTTTPLPAEHPGYHIFNTIGINGDTKCAYADCDAVIPSFNDIVNHLKDTSNNKNRFTTIRETASTDTDDLLIATMTGIKPSTISEFIEIQENRHLNKSTFYVSGKEYVSNLTEADVTSKKIEKVTDVDFAASFPKTIKIDNESYSTVSAKENSKGDFYKITVVVQDRAYDMKDTSDKVSVLDKIYADNFYETGIKNAQEEMLSSMKDFLDNMSCTITPCVTVEYFVTTDTYTPVAAKYSCNIAVNTAFIGDNSDDVFNLPTINYADNSYIFFNPTFTMAK